MFHKKCRLVVGISVALSMNHGQVWADHIGRELNFSELDGTNGFVINGINANDFSGASVSHAGDVNGDGIDDVIIGAIGTNAFTGSSYVLFGNEAGFANPINLSSLNGTNGIVINGENPEDWLGSSVSLAGDVNGDGLDDLIIGAIYASPMGNSEAGSAYVVFGSDTGFPNPLNLSTINGSNGFVINGLNAIDYLGKSVSRAGDFNGDGLDDIIIGAYEADPNGNTSAGSVYLVFGQLSGFTNPFELSSINGVNGVVFNGMGPGDSIGTSVSFAGDVNKDGIDDLIIGAQDADQPGFTSAGSSYVIFGDESGLPSPFSLASINGDNGYIMYGISDGDRSGFDVSFAGDVNNDGLDDMIIAAVNAEPNALDNAGSTYVVYGNDVIFHNDFEEILK